MEKVNTLLLEMEKLEAQTLICWLTSQGLDPDIGGEYLLIIDEAVREKDIGKLRKTVETIGLIWPKLLGYAG